MKILNRELKNPLQVIGIICFMLLMVMLIGCSKNEGLMSMADESTDGLLKSRIEVPPVVQLTGTTHFPSYAMQEHRVISPWDLNCLNCEATLTHVGGQDYLLETVESFGDMTFRKLSFEVKMTPSGSLKFIWPEAWEELDFATWKLAPNTMQVTDQIYLHTGCVVYGGAGVNQGTILYKGNFDGTRFYAAMNVIGKQEVYGTVAPFYTTPPLIQGPVRFNFSIELEEVD